MTGKNLLTNAQYDILKWIITIVLPACGTALLGLGEIFSWDWAPTVVQVLIIVETLLGAIFAISNATYSAAATTTADTYAEVQDDAEAVILPPITAKGEEDGAEAQNAGETEEE